MTQPTHPDERPLRLSIAHLLLWTLATAAWLAIGRESLTPAETPRERTAWSALLIFSSMFQGAAVCGVGLWLDATVRRRYRFPTEPGHWLLLASGAQGLTGLIVYAVWMLEPDSNLWPLYIVPTQTVGCMMALMALVRCCDAKRWTGMFVVNLAESALALVVTGLSVTFDYSINRQLFFIFFACLAECVPRPTALVVAVILDRRQWIRRDFAHWTGVAVIVGNSFLALASCVALLWSILYFGM